MPEPTNRPHVQAVTAPALQPAEDATGRTDTPPSITVDVVLEAGPLDEFTAWPISEIAGYGHLVLSGEMTSREVGTAIAVILDYNQVPLDRDTVLDSALLDRHLAEAEALNAPGGLRFRDIFLGHSPDPRLEHHDGNVRLWQDTETPEPTLTIRAEQLSELLAVSERNLQDFLALVRSWAETTIPNLATSLVTALDEHLQIHQSDRVEPLTASPTDAARVFTDLLQKAGRVPTDLTAESAWHHYLEFARIPFLAPNVPDADLLLYQYGVYSFSGQPRFHLTLTRQFALDLPEHPLLQFSCDLQFAPVETLQALGTRHDWWNPADGPPLTAWATAKQTGPEWSALASLTPLAVEIICSLV
ncbi:hypothetical protein GCM10027589_12630 [Actinocorallia lasiicapitis]